MTSNSLQSDAGYTPDDVEIEYGLSRRELASRRITPADLEQLEEWWESFDFASVQTAEYYNALKSQIERDFADAARRIGGTSLSEPVEPERAEKPREIVPIIIFDYLRLSTSSFEKSFRMTTAGLNQDEIIDARIRILEYFEQNPDEKKTVNWLLQKFYHGSLQKAPNNLVHFLEKIRLPGDEQMPLFNIVAENDNTTDGEKVIGLVDGYGLAIKYENSPSADKANEQKGVKIDQKDRLPTDIIDQTDLFNLLNYIHTNQDFAQELAAAGINPDIPESAIEALERFRSPPPPMDEGEQTEDYIRRKNLVRKAELESSLAKMAKLFGDRKEQRDFINRLVERQDNPANLSIVFLGQFVDLQTTKKFRKILQKSRVL